jgi:hypothetical protein
VKFHFAFQLEHFFKKYSILGFQYLGTAVSIENGYGLDDKGVGV